MKKLSHSASAWLHWPETEALITAFHQAGYPLRFVGGAVRDTLLNREVLDIDAATPAPPQKTMAIAEAAGMKAIPTGLSHGTITIVVNHRPFEVTTLRRDIKNYGRHAEVLFTNDWEEDAARRDFTMNALYADADGNVHDYFGGVEDAQTGRVIFIGDPTKRIQEDALRILRFFRFFAHYGEGNIDKAGLDACTAEAARIKQLSAERIGAEMFKLLSAERAADVIKIMQEAGILQHLISATVDVASLAAFRRVRLMAESETIDPMIPLALLLRSWPYPEAVLEEIVKRWRLSGKQAAQLKTLVETTAIQTEDNEATQKRILRKVGAEMFIAQVLLSWAERLSENPSQPQILSAAYRSMLGLPARWQAPVFPINGTDLRALGMLSGPKMGQILAELETKWEAENYRPTKEMLLESLNT